MSELRRCRRLGLAGSCMVAVAGLGAGATPLSNRSWLGITEPHGVRGAAVAGAYLGLTLLTAAWLRLGRHLTTLDSRQLAVTAGWWAAPLLLAPPMWSRDVYSYLAQGALLIRGLDPYRFGPDALGGALATNVSPIWQQAPAPYGPVFLLPASWMMRLTGGHTVTAVLGMRLLALLGLALFVWCLPRLARLGGGDPATALWLGVLNPIVLAHLVAGAHNDALMIGLMVTGLLLVLGDCAGSAEPGRDRMAVGVGVGWRTVAGIALISLATLVKLPAAVALVFVVPPLAHRLGGRLRPSVVAYGLAAAGTAGVAALTVVAATVASRIGYGWLAALADQRVVRNGLSVSTDLGLLIGAPGQALGLLDEATVLAVCRSAGVALALAFCGWALLRTGTSERTESQPRQFGGNGYTEHGEGRESTSQQFSPAYALGLALGALALLGPVVHPWYLVWGLAPLAAGPLSARMRRFAIWVSLVFVFVVLPTGNGLTPATVGGALAGLALGVGIVRLPRLRASAPSHQDGAKTHAAGASGRGPRSAMPDKPADQTGINAASMSPGIERDRRQDSGDHADGDRGR